VSPEGEACEVPYKCLGGFATFIFHLLDFAQAGLTHLQMKNAPTFVEAFTLVLRGERGIIRFAHDPLISGSQNQIIRCAGFYFLSSP
jgi:hypothetical protein